MKINPKNERVKRLYRIYIKEARQLDDLSIDAIDRSIDRFESYTNRRDFRGFREEQAIAFKRHLAEAKSVRTGEKLSKATVYSMLTALKDFFFWLAGQPGFKSRLRYDAADYFKMSLKDVAVARAAREERVPSLEQIRAVLAAMSVETTVDRRNRALIAFTILTGARDNAIASARLKHVDLDEREFFQDGREVRTKFAKTFPTFFFPVGDDIESIVRDWVGELRREHRFGPEDPLFPPTKVAVGNDGNFVRAGFEKRCWSGAGPIRTVFREAFAQAVLPSFNPHSFRKTLVRLGLELGLGEAGLKAWSQNLGHDGVLVTLKSYGSIPAHRQRELIRAAARAGEDDAVALRLGRELMRKVRELGGV